MNTRERTLAIILIVVMIAVAGAVGGYILVWQPLKRTNDQLAKVGDEIKDLEGNKSVLLMQQYEYENKTRKMSLPANPKPQADPASFRPSEPGSPKPPAETGNPNAQRMYTILLDKMLREARFTAPGIDPKPFNDKSNVPMLSGKKPAYGIYGFSVHMTGDLAHFIDFLYNFYRQPILQQIKSVNIVKLAGSRNAEANASRELDITLQIEALLLDRAEERATLMPAIPSVVGVAGGGGAVSYGFVNEKSGLGSPFSTPGVLARGNDMTNAAALKEYERIAGKNIFFEPVMPGSTGPRQQQKDPELGPYLQLQAIWHSDGVSHALIFDRINQQDYDVGIDSRGNTVVTNYFYEPVERADGEGYDQVRRKHQSTRQLIFGSEQGGNLHKYWVRRILEHELVLENADGNGPDREKAIKGPGALLLAGIGASAVMPSKLMVWHIDHFLVSVDPRRKSDFPAGNLDTKRAAREITSAAEIRTYLSRSLDFDNSGDGILNFTSDGVPPGEQTTAEPKEGKNTRPGMGQGGPGRQRGKKGKGN